MKHIRLAGLALVFTLSLVAVVVVVKHRRLSPESLTYTPIGPEVDAKTLVAKMFETNRPWLETQPIWASYKLRRKLRRISLENVYRLRSLRHLFESQQSTEGPFTARWRSPEDLRVGAAIWTPLQGMFKNRDNYTVHAIGTTQWRGRQVLALEVNFFQPLGCEMGMGAGSFHYSYARFPAQAARILVEPERALPLFIGTSAQGGFSAGQPYASGWEFDPDFMPLQGGLAPRRVKWTMQDTWDEDLEFQVTARQTWMFLRGAAHGGGGKHDRWSRWSLQIELVGLQLDQLRPGDLLQQYSTVSATGASSNRETLPDGQTIHQYLTGSSAGAASPHITGHWELMLNDLFLVSHFQFGVGRDLQLELGESHLGIGHDANGALFAVIVPRENGKLIRRATNEVHPVAHVFLRFHPQTIRNLFPPETVSADATNMRAEMCAIANLKLVSTWPPDTNTALSDSTQYIIDVDTQQGLRRYFRLETIANEARYVPALEDRAVSRLVSSTEGLEQPLPNFVQDATDETQDSNRPRVVSVFPLDGAAGIAPVTELRVRFDRPMEPLSLKLTWDCGGFTNCDFPKYDAERYEFSIPVCLAAGKLHQIVINEPWSMPGMSIAEVRKRTPQEGFRSAERRLGCVFAWRFFTQKLAEAGAGNDLSRLSSEASSSSDDALLDAAPKAQFDEPGLSPEQAASQLLDLLVAVKRQRSQLTALSERVQELSQGRKGGWFVGLSSTGSSFKWQSPQHCFGDVSDIMGCPAFRIGSDAEHCWMQDVNEARETVQVWPAKEVGRWELSFCDPFGLAGRTPAEAVGALGLKYSGLIRRGDEQWHVIESSRGRQLGAGVGTVPNRTRWRIDPRTYLLAEILTSDSDRLSRTRFLYDSINQPLSTAAFAVPRPKGVSIQQADALDAAYTNRFIRVSDGSNGRMSLGIGKFGPGGTSTSGGLN